MRDTIVGMVLARGFDVGDYRLLAFGGAGPSHVAAYTQDLRLRDILIFPFSSAFCAFGAATCDHVRNYTRAINLVAPQTPGEATRRELQEELARVWSALQEEAVREVPAASQASLRLEYRVRMRYGRQLDQILVRAPVRRPAEIEWNALVRAFEETYAAKYSASARFPQAGYEAVEASVVASVPRTKPRLPRFAPGQPTPPPSALRGSRRAFFRQRWWETPVYDWGALQPGNRLEGPAIVETDTQTLVVPPRRSLHVDEHLAIHLSCHDD
jgi:acetone carboxylase beta subunit